MAMAVPPGIRFAQSAGLAHLGYAPVRAKLCDPCDEIHIIISIAVVLALALALALPCWHDAHGMESD
jgi:hypothetical protein